MIELKYALRDERINIFAMTIGKLNGSYSHQIILCKKTPFTKNYSGPFLLIPKSSPSQYHPSKIGADYLNSISKIEFPRKYVAYVDCYIKVNISYDIFDILCSSGFFDIWLPSEPFNYFQGMLEGYLPIFRVYEISNEIDNSLLSRGLSGRNFYFKLEEPVNIELTRPVINDELFQEMKSEIINLLKSHNSLVEYYDSVETDKSYKSPPWSRDELILALDLYMRHNPIKINAKHKEIINLSNILKKLSTHDGNNKFRNPTGVYMKLCNYLRFDPEYPGTGLTRGGKLEEIIWKEFSNKPEYLNNIAKSIIYNIENSDTSSNQQIADDEEFPEGKILYRQHIIRERNSTLVKKIKKIAEENNSLFCSICEFDFYKKYGDLGKGYIECHHVVPVSDYTKNRKTKIKDLILVCSNCHRMLHRKRPWLTQKELKLLINVE